VSTAEIIEFSAYRSLTWNKHVVRSELELKKSTLISPTLNLPMHKEVLVQSHINGLILGGTLVSMGKAQHSHVVCYQLPHDKVIPHIEVIRMIRDCGYDLATLDELIAYTIWTQAPETKWGQPILALGTCCDDKDGEPFCATYIGIGIDTPGLYMQWVRYIHSQWVLLIRVPRG
jgi:hypothetical protein